MDNKLSNKAKSILVLPPQGDNLFDYSTPSLGLGYIAASVIKDGNDAKIFDCNFYPDYIKSLVRLISDYKPDLIGITGFTFQYPKVMDMCKLIKEKHPDIKIALGGPHASVLSEFIVSNLKTIDYVVKGEGEESFSGLLKAVKSNSGFENVTGLYYLDNGKVHKSGPVAVKNLDELEYPWTVINPLDYQKGQVHGFICRQFPVAQVLSSRGCPYLCTFCAGRAVHGSKIRMRDPYKFVDELEFLKNEYGIREIQIIDDNFTFFRDHAVKVADEIIKRKLDITWSLPNGVRADRLDRELLIKLKKSGCYSMSFGIEFGSDRMLKICKKALNLDTAIKNITLASRLGFITQGFFLMGHPEEKEEDILNTREFIRKVPFDKILISMPFPYPGSELFDFYLKERYKGPKNIDWYNFKESDFERILEYTNTEFIRSIRKSVYLRFYFNPLNSIRFLSKFRTFTQFKVAFNGFKVLVKTLTGRQ